MNFKRRFIVNGVYKIMKKYIIIIFAALYLLSYGEVRRSHLLVHTSSFSGSKGDDKLTYSHGVYPTDVIGLLQPRLFYTVVLADLIFKPLIYGEVMYWYVVEPRDSLWQYEVEEKPP